MYTIHFLLLEETQHSSLWAAVPLHIKRSDNIIKMYIERNSMHVELI